MQGLMRENDSLKNRMLRTAGVVGNHDELISAVKSGNSDVAELAGLPESNKAVIRKCIYGNNDLSF